MENGGRKVGALVESLGCKGLQVQLPALGQFLGGLRSD